MLVSDHVLGHTVSAMVSDVTRVSPIVVIVAVVVVTIMESAS